MFVHLDADQRHFQRVIRSFVDSRSPSSEVRRLADTLDGYDPAVWKEMAEQLELQALNIPEEYGGAGFSSLETAIVFEELGRTLMCTPYFSTVGLATELLLAVGDEAACHEFLPGIASGAQIATVAICDETGRMDTGSLALSVGGSAQAPELSGERCFVTDGALADLVLVVARDAHDARGASVFAVSGDASGLTRERSSVLDGTRKQARLSFNAVPARLIGTAGGAWPAVRRALDRAMAYLSVEQVGGIDALLQMSVAYARDREQFGRPIGSFQAIKHKCADMLVQLESARSAAAHAVWAAAESPDQLPAASAMAKAFCSEAFTAAARQTIQIHGGVGFTWDHDAHLYLRRAKSSELLFGSPALHRERLAQAIGIS